MQSKGAAGIQIEAPEVAEMRLHLAGFTLQHVSVSSVLRWAVLRAPHHCQASELDSAFSPQAAQCWVSLSSLSLSVTLPSPPAIRGDPRGVSPQVSQGFSLKLL